MDSRTTGQPARRFKELTWSTRKSWSRKRRVIAKAEWTQGEANPRFIVTSLTAADGDGRRLYEQVYCARGEMENRIKECQMDLFADRTSTATMRANQLRLWSASMAYVLLESLAASPCRRPTWPMPPAAPSAASCSRSARSSPSVSVASSSPWRPAVLTRQSLPQRIGRLPPQPTPAEPSAPADIVVWVPRGCWSCKASARPPSPSCRAESKARLASGECGGQPEPPNTNQAQPTRFPAPNRCGLQTQCEISGLRSVRSFRPVTRADAIRQ